MYIHIILDYSLIIPLNNFSVPYSIKIHKIIPASLELDLLSIAKMEEDLNIV